MTVTVVAFPSERVFRTPAQIEQHRQAQFDANVARLVELLEANPQIRAMADAKIARDRSARKLPS